MTDQPTKGVWALLYKSNSAVYLQKDTGVTCDEVRFIGPDREANARKFMLVDDLVEALQGMISWAEDRPEKHPVDTWADARDILAKIKEPK